MNNVIQDDKVSDTKDVRYKKGHRMGCSCEHAKVLSMAWLQPSQLRGMYTGPLTGNANRASEGTVSIRVCCFDSSHREMFPKT